MKRSSFILIIDPLQTLPKLMAPLSRSNRLLGEGFTLKHDARAS